MLTSSDRDGLPMEPKHFVKLLVALLVVPAAIALLLREPDAGAIAKPAPQPTLITEAEKNLPVDAVATPVVAAGQPVPLSEWAADADLSDDPAEDLSPESLAALREALLEGAVSRDDLARDRPEVLAALQQQGPLDVVAEQRQRLEDLSIRLDQQHQDVSSQLADLQQAISSPAASSADWPEAESSLGALEALQADIEQAQRLTSLQRSQLARQHPQN
jgi:hypothetical protein